MTTTPPDTDGWTEYRVFVLSELKRHSNMLEKLTRDATNNRVSIARAAALGGAIPAAITAIIALAQLLG
ncbi:MAG: hypothetical protein KAJ19_28325 [Gammaproteobacteria bacterium]|nr:hypothetical protein [Gammaproteobacteria bacterium]